ncbi:MAG: ABC transporter permease [Hyphomicrobium sp.]
MNDLTSASVTHWHPLQMAQSLWSRRARSWFLASLGVYVRDKAQIVMSAVTVMMFLTPIFYPLQLLPAGWHAVLPTNPMTLPVEEARAAMHFGHSPNFGGLAVLTLIAFTLFWLGWAWFEQTHKGFADVI